jgi:beta-glucanase (GH16 family)
VTASGGSARGGATGSGGGTNGGASNGGATANGGSESGGSTNGGSPGDGGGNAGGAGSGGVPNLPGWTLLWNDEFDGPVGSGVDSSKWNLVNKGDGFGNNELQFYRNGTNNAAMDGNGNLVITAKKESYSGRNYTSAKLESSGKFDHMYGRFESRMKIPRGQGMWPAFWMLGNDIGSVGWPTCGEVDIMENIGREPTMVHGTLHGPGYSGGNPLGASYTLPNGAEFADDFHEFAVEWEENVVRFYVDDNLYKTRTPADVPSGSRWVYDHAFYMILNVAVGGQWPGNPDGTTQFPQTMTVDYVRVYTR